MEQQFGEKEVCFRTLDLYTSAVLEASLNPAATPKAEYREAMAEMSKVHCLCRLLPAPPLVPVVTSMKATGQAQAV